MGVVNFRDLGGYPTPPAAHRWGASVPFRRPLPPHTERSVPILRPARRCLGLRPAQRRRAKLHPNPVPSRQFALESHVPRQEFSDGSALRSSQSTPRTASARSTSPSWRRPDRCSASCSLRWPNRTPPPGRHPLRRRQGPHGPGGRPPARCARGRAGRRSSYDYELTGSRRRPSVTRRYSSRFVATGMSPEAAHALLGAPRWVMEAALDVIDDEYVPRGTCGVPPASARRRWMRFAGASSSRPRRRRIDRLGGDRRQSIGTCLSGRVRRLVAKGDPWTGGRHFGLLPRDRPVGHGSTWPGHALFLDFDGTITMRRHRRVPAAAVGVA